MRVSFVSMRAAALFALLILTPTPAGAQPVFVDDATLRIGAREVGWLAGGPALITGWPGAREVELHFEDDVLILDARVTLDGDSTLSATPGQVVTLERTGAFTVEMLPGTFARIVERDAAGRLRIQLPSTLPRGTASMPLGSPGTPSAPAAPEPPDDSWQSICSPTRVFARASRRATAWTVDGPDARAEVGPESHGFWPVRVWIDGYLVHGFLDHELPTGIGCGSGSGSAVCGGAGRSVRTRVTLPAGTALFGAAASSAPFATLRVPYLATMVDAGDIPDAPVAWRIERSGDGARWSLEVWLHVEASVLRGLPRPSPEP